MYTKNKSPTECYNIIESYFDRNFYKKNIDTPIFASIIYYNTNNKTLNEFNIIKKASNKEAAVL